MNRTLSVNRTPPTKHTLSMNCTPSMNRTLSTKHTLSMNGTLRRQRLRSNQGSALVEFLLVPLLVLPLVLTLAHIWTVQQSQLAFTDVARQLSRTSGLSDSVSKSSVRSVVWQLLADFDVESGTEVAVTSGVDGWHIHLHRTTTPIGFLPATSVERSVTIPR